MFNRPLTSKDAKSYADDLVETIELLEEKIEELEQKLIEEVTIANNKGFDEGYAACEKDRKPKPFHFR